MSITTFSELKTAIANWAHRSDLTSHIPDAITMAEAKFNRRLRVKDMETALAATAIASGLISRPSGLVAVKALWGTDENRTRVESKPLDYVLNNRNASSSIPYFYAWDRTYFHFDTDSGTVEGVYYTSITALSDSNTSNWLLTASPDLYLAASLGELYLYALEEERAALWTSKANALIDELNKADRRDRMSGNPLAARVIK